MSSWEGQERAGIIFAYSNTAAEETRQSRTRNKFIVYVSWCVDLQNFILVQRQWLCQKISSVSKGKVLSCCEFCKS